MRPGSFLSSMEFAGDERAQSVQIGAVLLFAVLVLALVGYQATVVPQQNREAEFKHFQEIKSDFVDARNTVFDTYSTGASQSAGFDLGTTYPTRIFALNPPAPNGQLRTTEPAPVEIRNGSGTDVSTDVCPGSTSPETRLLTYTPGYNVLQGSDLYVGNTVAYLRTEDGDTLARSGQQFVSGSRINLLLLAGDAEASGQGTTSLDFVAGPYNVRSVTDPQVTIPTKLSESSWAEILDASKYTSLTYDDTTEPHTMTIQFDGTFDVTCSAVGIGNPPPSGERTDGAISGSDDTEGGDGADGVNPAGAGTVSVASTDWQPGSPPTIEIVLKNNGDEDRTLAEARVPFYYEKGGQREVQQLVLNDDAADTLGVGDPMTAVTPVTIPAGGTATITLADSDMQEDDLFEFDVEYDDGSTARYFIDVSDTATGGPESIPSDVTDVASQDDTALRTMPSVGTETSSATGGQSVFVGGPMARAIDDGQ